MMRLDVGFSFGDEALKIRRPTGERMVWAQLGQQAPKLAAHHDASPGLQQTP